MLIYSLDLEITWKPFKVVSHNWPWTVFYILVLAAGLLVYFHGYAEGLSKGAEIEKNIIEKINNQEDETDRSESTTKSEL